MIYKFKTFDEAQKALWSFEPDERYYALVKDLFALANKLYPPRCRQGIFLFKTIEEANDFRRKEEIQKALDLINND